MMRPDLVSAADEVARAAVLPLEGYEMDFRAAKEMASVNVAVRILPILSRLVLAAKVEALLDVAKRGCANCSREIPLTATTGAWTRYHDTGDGGFAFCWRPEIHDAIAKLREEVPRG